MTQRDKQDIYWEDNPKFGRLKGTEGKISLTHVRWRGIHAVDLRLLRRTEDDWQHTRQGIRLTHKQLQEIIPQLVLISDAMQNEKEESKRKADSKIVDDTEEKIDHRTPL